MQVLIGIIQTETGQCGSSPAALLVSGQGLTNSYKALCVDLTTSVASCRFWY